MKYPYYQLLAILEALNKKDPGGAAPHEVVQAPFGDHAEALDVAVARRLIGCR
jgi:hypothetical protein